MPSDRTPFDELASWTVIAVVFAAALAVDGLRWWWRFLRSRARAVLRGVANAYRFGGQRGNRL